MSAAQIAQARIKELEQLLAKAQGDANKSHADYMQTRDEMLTARNTFLRCKQGWRLQLGNTLGTEVAEVSEGIQLLVEQRDAADSKARKMTRTADELARINERLDQQIVDLRRTQFRTFADEECWIWQGDGSDNLDTLVCPVVISAGDLKGLISERDRLLDGYPEGMTPTDVRKLKEYNAELAQDNAALQAACEGIQTLAAQAKGLINRTASAATAENEYSQGVCHDGAAILKNDQPMTIEEVLAELRRTPLRCEHQSTVISGVRMDELDASLEVEAWFKDVIEQRGYRSEPSSCMRHDGLDSSCGRVSSLWVNNRPVATAVLLRDEFNYTAYVGSEHNWVAQAGTTKQHQNAGDRGGKGYEREALGQNNEGDTVTV